MGPIWGQFRGGLGGLFGGGGESVGLALVSRWFGEYEADRGRLWVVEQTLSENVLFGPLSVIKKPDNYSGDNPLIT